MEQTLCISCNRPAPEFDRYKDLAHTLLSVMASGITLMRMSQESPRETPRGLTQWKTEANATIHLGNDFRDEVNQNATVHRDCDAWKITTRRINALCRDLHFELRLVRGIA